MFSQMANMLQLQRILLPRDSQFFCWRWHLQHLTVKHLVIQVKIFLIGKNIDGDLDQLLCFCLLKMEQCILKTYSVSFKFEMRFSFARDPMYM